MLSSNDYEVVQVFIMLSFILAVGTEVICNTHGTPGFSCSCTGKCSVKLCPMGRYRKWQHAKWNVTCQNKRRTCSLGDQSYDNRMSHPLWQTLLNG